MRTRVCRALVVVTVLVWGPLDGRAASQQHAEEALLVWLGVHQEDVQIRTDGAGLRGLYAARDYKGKSKLIL